MNDIRVTFREVLFSCIIVCAMIGIGVWISNPLLASFTNDAMKVTSSVKVSATDRFDYIGRTDVGDFLAEGTLAAIDPVSNIAIDGKYLKIRKDRERYTMHTSVEIVDDGKGRSHMRTRTWWSWDLIKRSTYSADSVSFLGKEFVLDSISYNAPMSYVTTVSVAPNERIQYYVHPAEKDGVLAGTCTDRTYRNLSFNEGETIDSVVKSAEDSMRVGPIVFWILWILLTAFIVLLFVIYENEWLED